MTVLFTKLKVVTGKSDRHIAKIHTTVQLDSILCAYNLDWHYHKWKKWLSFSPPTRELLNIFEMSLVVHGLEVIVFVCDVIFSMRLQFALRYYSVLIRTYHTVLCTKIKHISYGIWDTWFNVLFVFCLIEQACLTHFGWVTKICVSKLTLICSDNGLSPDRRQAIIWTNAGILSIGPMGTNFSEILIKVHTFSFKKIHLKMPSGNAGHFLSASMC